MENHENLIGKVLGGRYKIQAIVGEGGMSVVMKAYDALKMRDVTIKLLNYKNSAEPHTVERFTNEAKAVALLSHPNIVSVYDVSLEGASKYIVMEYINGITLKEYLNRKVRLDWPEAVHYINQVLSALSHAHEKGVIHRDIKPENVMLMRNGSIKVIDFGIAKLPDSKSLTVTDKAIGTVNYISPEQASGHGSSEKSDIYSTGIMLYELVTGQLPFVSASSVSVAMMHVSSEPAMPSSICDSIPVGLEQIIIKAMMKSPDRRFGSAIAMKKALEYLTAYPSTIFNEKSSIGPDGKPILSTGAPQNNGNNTVITEDVTPMDGRMVNGTVRPDVHPGYNNPDDTDNHDEDEDEDEYSYVKPARSTMFPIILGVTAAFFTVLILFGIFFLNKIEEGSKNNSNDNILVVPDLVGKEFTSLLEAELESQGYRLDVKRVANADVPSGYIIYQEPLADSTRMYREDGVSLALEVSEGTSEIVLQDNKHRDVADVRLELESKGIKVKTQYEFNDTVIMDHVIRTESDKETLIEGDEVTLIVSKGPEDVMVEIPEYIIGLSYSEAERKLQDLGINVHEEKGSGYSDEYEVNKVIGTEPAIGTSVSVNNDKVKLIINEEREPAEEATETMGGNGDYTSDYPDPFGNYGNNYPKDINDTIRHDDDPKPTVSEEHTAPDSEDADAPSEEAADSEDNAEKPADDEH